MGSCHLGNPVEDNFNQNRGTNSSQNRGNNFYQGQVYQTPTSQPPFYQAQPYQAHAQQVQGVSKTDFENYVKANDAVLRNMQNQGQGLQNQIANLTDMLSKFVNANTASSSGTGTLPSNTVTNPKEDLKGITKGPTIPTTSSPKVVERETEVTKDKMPPTNNGSIEDVQPPRVASLKPKSIDKGRRYKRRKETKGKKVVSSLVFQEEVDTGAKEVNTAEGVNTGSIKLSTVSEQVSTGSAKSSCTPFTSSTNIPEKEVLAGFADEVIYSLFAKQTKDLDLLHEDLEQIDDVDIEEMDIIWQIAIIAIRIKKFYKKTGRRVRVDGKTPVGFDKKKLECFNCHNTGHFARECTAKGIHDRNNKRDSLYQHQKAGKQEKNQMGLLTMDDGIVNWGEHTEAEETNHALMAISSSNEVSLCSKTCIDSYNKLKLLYDEQMNQLGDQEAQILAYSQAVKKLEAQLVTSQKQQLSLNEKLAFQANEIHEKDEKLKRYRRIGMKAVKDKEQLQKTVDSWKDSSKNLWRLIDSGMSSNSKVGLGFEIQSNNEVLSYEEEMNFSVFKYYTPKPQEEIDDSLYVYGKKGPQKPEISVSDDNSSEHSTCQSNDSEGSCGNTSEHSFETESESLSEPNEMSKSRLEVTNEKDEKLKRYRRIGMKAVKEKEQLQKTVDSWKDSSKNLWRLINSGMSSNDKLGLGFEIQSNDEVLSYEEEMNFSVFKCSKEDSIGKPSYSRFTKTNEFKGVPPPLSGDYTPQPQEEIDDSLYVYGKKGPQKPEISVSDENSSEHSTCQSNDSEGSCENTSEHSFETESESLSEPNEMSKSRLEVTNEKDVSAPKSKEVEPSCVSHIKTPRQPLKDKETHKVNRKSWNDMMERELREDCDYYEKKMARESEVKRVVNTGNGMAKPVWTNANRINHTNQFVPRSVQLNAGRPKFNTVRPNINTGRTNINSGRPKVNAVSPKVNSVRSKQPVTLKTSNNSSPKRPQMNQMNQRWDFSKSYSSVRRPFANSTAQMANSNAVMGSWGSAVKTSASYNWRNTRPNFNYNSGPTSIRTVNANGPQGRPKPAKAWVPKRN
ncbi:ribonuclease H-like domain-containing protein [Tanacetum coccineum]